MEKAPLGIEKAREERINSNTERMKQLGIHTIARDVNDLSNMKKIDPTRKKRVEMSNEEQDMHVEEYNPLNSSDESSSEEEAPQKKKKKKRKMDSNPAIHSRVSQEQCVVGEGSSHQNPSTSFDIGEYNPSTSSDSSSGEEEAPPKKTRGRTTCANLGKKTNLRIRFNRHGHPKGKMLSKYLTYVATVTKERIPITIKNWKEVDKKLKEECWEEIKQFWGIKTERGFVHAKKKMNSAWKNFKSDLINDYMRADQEPFSKYNWISSQCWEEFVRQKSTQEFQKLSQNNREMCKRNDNPHRLGSRGYDVKKRVWKKKLKENSADLAPILDIKD